MPIRRQDRYISESDLIALFSRFESGTSVDDGGAINFLRLDHDELERILPDAFEADTGFTPRQVRHLLREALWNCRREGRLGVGRFVDEAQRLARARLSQPRQPYALWTKFRATQMAFSQGFTLIWNDVVLESANNLPAYMTRDEYFINGHGRVNPREPVSFGHLLARCEARDEESAVSKMLDAIDIFMALFNMHETWGRRSIGSDNWAEGQLWNGPYQFVFQGERFLGNEHVWYDPDFNEVAWNRFPIDMNAVLRMVPEVQRGLEALSSHPLRELLLKVLRLMQNAMCSRDQAYTLLRYWSALEQLYGDLNTRDRNYNRIVQRATFAESDKQIARWKLGHIARVRNEYVHAGRNDDDLRVMSHYLRTLLTHHINYLMFHAPDVRTHAQWLEIVDLPDDEGMLEARKVNIDRRIAIIRRSTNRDQEG
jgi:hypothetical protein